MWIFVLKKKKKKERCRNAPRAKAKCQSSQAVCGPDSFAPDPEERRRSTPESQRLGQGGKRSGGELPVYLIIYQLAARTLMCAGICLCQHGLCTLALLLGDVSCFSRRGKKQLPVPCNDP